MSVDSLIRRPWWTPWPGTGPGTEVLGDITGLRMVELGCGNGNNAAYFATAGAAIDAVDSAPEAVATARARWGHIGGLHLAHVDAAAFLADKHGTYDAACSIFGALSFSGPDLMELIASSLRPGGVVALVARLTGKAGTRSAADWADLVTSVGFTVRYWSVIEHPDDVTSPACLVCSACVTT